MFRSSVAALLALPLATLAPLRAEAAGQAIPDQGGKGGAEGGAFIAKPDDLSAAYYNPAGLADLPGLQVQLDANILSLQASFQRAETDKLTFDKTTNAGSPSINPMFAVSYQLKPTGLFPVTVALSGAPFPGYLGSRYADPEKIRAQIEAEGRTPSDLEMASLTPQRYTSINADTIIYIPALTVAARPVEWMAIGLQFQNQLAWIRQKQAIYAAPDPNLDSSGTGEGPTYDALFEIDAATTWNPSAQLGLSFALPAGVHVGLAAQLPTTFTARGTVRAVIPDSLKSQGIGVTGDKANIQITFPWILRGGVRLVRDFFEVELAGVWETWSQQKTILLTPEDIAITGATAEPLPVPAIPIAKDYVDAGSLRLGGSFKPGKFVDALKFLEIRAGGLYETSAVTTARQSIDVPSWERFGVHAGVGLTFGDFELSLMYAKLIAAPRTVTDSTLEQTVAFTKTEQFPNGVTPRIVGNGTYTTDIDMFTATIRWHFDTPGTPAAVAPSAPSASPVPAPTDPAPATP